MAGLPRHAGGEFFRFTVVAVIGLVIDIGVSWWLATLIGLPLWLAAACGFLVAALGNYLLHENWTFATGQVTARRGFKYFAVLLASLAIRLAAVVMLERWVFAGENKELAILLIASGVSFFVSFALSRTLVFENRNAMSGTNPN